MHKNIKRPFLVFIAIAALIISFWQFKKVQASSLADIRNQNWATSYDGWEVLFDGTDTPADNVPQQLVWDNPFDDDWNEPRVASSSIAFNTPSPGFYTIDRATNPLDHQKNGNIMRRDEFLSAADGLTLETRFKVNPNSSQDAIFLTLLNDAGSITVFFSPGAVKLASSGSVPVVNPRAVATFDTMSFHTYRVVWLPHSLAVSVYVDGQSTPLVQGLAYTEPRVGSSTNIDFPFILFGDNSQNPNFNASFVLDYLKYRRGAYQWLSKLDPILPRVVPPLPSPASSSEQFTAFFDGSHTPLSLGYQAQGSSAAWTPLSGGYMDFNSLSSGAGTFAIVDPVPTLVNKDGTTIEMRAKVMPDSPDRGFTLTFLDEMGSVSLTLSKQKVETLLGLKPAGYQSYPVNLTDDFHIFRLVRPAHSMYAYLYLDDNPDPVIYDQHLDASTEVHGFPVQPYMQFGSLGYVDRFRSGSLVGHVVIDYIRWHDGASAPIPKGAVVSTPAPVATTPPLPDSALSVAHTGPGPWPTLRLTCSEDGGQTFKIGTCTSDAAILQWQTVLNANTCVGSATPRLGNRWEGFHPFSGTETVEVVTAPRGYTMECSGNGGTSIQSVIVQPKTVLVTPSPTPTPTPTPVPSPVPPPTPPAPVFTAPLPDSELSVTHTGPGPWPTLRLTCSEDGGQTFKIGTCSSNVTILQWLSVQNANTCVGSATPRLGNRWEGFHPFSGTETVEAITAPRGYTMECSGNGGTSKQSVIVWPK